MRNALFLSVGFVLILIQANLFRITGPFQLVGATPNLVLPLVVLLGIQEHSMVRGAALSFALGYLLDLVAGAPVGVLTFTHVACWWIARVAGVRLTSQTWLTRLSLGFVFSAVQAAIVLILLAVFGSDTRRPVEVGLAVLPHIGTTGLLAPFILKLGQRLAQASQPATSSAEGTGR